MRRSDNPRRRRSAGGNLRGRLGSWGHLSQTVRALARLTNRSPNEILGRTTVVTLAVTGAYKISNANVQTPNTSPAELIDATLRLAQPLHFRHQTKDDPNARKIDAAIRAEVIDALEHANRRIVEIESAVIRID